MLFLEPWFWTFAAAAVVGFLLLPQALRIWWLLASSVIFYFHFAGVGGVLVVTILATLCWGAGLTSTRFPQEQRVLVRRRTPRSAGWRTSTCTTCCDRTSSSIRFTSPRKGTAASPRRLHPRSRTYSGAGCPGDAALSVREPVQTGAHPEARNAIADQRSQRVGHSPERAIPEDEVADPVHCPGRRRHMGCALQPRRLHEQWPPAPSDGAHEHDDRETDRNDLLPRAGERGHEQAEAGQAEDDHERERDERQHGRTEGNTEREMTEGEEDQHLHDTDRVAGEQLPAEQRATPDGRHAQARDRTPVELVTQAEGDPEDEAHQDEHHAEPRDVLLEGGRREARAGQIVLVQRQELLRERVRQGRRLGVGEHEVGLHGVDLGPLRRIGEEREGRRLPAQIALAETLGQHQGSGSPLLDADQRLGAGSVDLDHVDVLAERLGQHLRDPALILVNDRQQDRTAVVSSEGLGHDRDHDDGDQEREEDRGAVPGDEPEVFQRDGEQAHESLLARSPATLLRISSRRSSKERVRSSSWNCCA